MGTVIAIANQKGGTGKTTTALNLGAALARFHQRKVLLLDLDPQGSLTIYAGLLPEKVTYHIGSVLRQLNRFDESLNEYYLPELKLLPSHPSLDDFVQMNGPHGNWEKNLSALLKNASRKFDYIIIDCPPSLGAITFQVLCNTDALIIPLQCEYMALRGIQLLLKAVEKARVECNSNLQIMGILPTMFDRRTLHSKEVLEEIHTALRSKIHIFSTIIYKTVRFPESAVSLLPIFEYDPENSGALAYKDLSEQIIHYG
jgi:ATPases involved in chromosome partitioning